MKEPTPLMIRIAQLKGEMTYAEFAESICRRTGKRLAANTLQALGAGTRAGRIGTLKVIAQYAGKPLSWLYEPLDPAPDAAAEARTEYLAPTGDPGIDENRRQLLEAWMRTGERLSEETLRRLMGLAEVLPPRDEDGK